MGAIGDISRFKSSNHLVGYLGLAPRVKQSGYHAWYGSITKAGAKEARRLLVLAARHLKTHPGPFGEFYRRLSARKHGNVATVAGARKLVEVAYHMLTNDEPYRYAVPERTQSKLDKLHKSATGSYRPKEPIVIDPAHEAPKPEESGYRREAHRSLNDVLERAHLPRVDWNQLSAGEQRTTKMSGEYVESLQHSFSRYRRERRQTEDCI